MNFATGDLFAASGSGQVDEPFFEAAAAPPARRTRAAAPLRATSMSMATLLRQPEVQTLRPASFRLMVYLASGISPPSAIATRSAVRDLVAAGFDISEQGKRSRSRIKGPFSDYRTRQGRPLPLSWAERFDIFWDLFDHKVGRTGALTAWYRLEERNLAEPLDFDTIFEGARQAAQRAAQRPDETRKHAEGWLNDQRWTDAAASGTYTAAQLALMDMFNRLCPNARKASDYTPRRESFLRAALARLDLDGWEVYFRFLNTVEGLTLLAAYKGGISLVQALSPELEARARDYLHELRPDLAAAEAAEER